MGKTEEFLLRTTNMLPRVISFRRASPELKASPKIQRLQSFKKPSPAEKAGLEKGRDEREVE